MPRSYHSNLTHKETDLYQIVFKLRLSRGAAAGVLGCLPIPRMTLPIAVFVVMGWRSSSESPFSKSTLKFVNLGMTSWPRYQRLTGKCHASNVIVGLC